MITLHNIKKMALKILANHLNCGATNNKHRRVYYNKILTQVKLCKQTDINSFTWFFDTKQKPFYFIFF